MPTIDAVNRPVRLYADRDHYQSDTRAELCSILRPFWKDRAFTDDQRRTIYGVTERDFVCVSELTQADLAVLPMSWNHYLGRGQTHRAHQFVESARVHGKPILAHTTGDCGITPPWPDVFVTRPSGYRSHRRPRELGQPVFIRDPLNDVRGGHLIARSKGLRPVVGFCGMSHQDHTRALYDIGRTAIRNVLTAVKVRMEDPQSLTSPAWLRGKILRQLAADRRVDANFVIRSRYRAGAKTHDAMEQAARAFVHNVLESDYTVCVRGGGNFSKRFYETLAMGRVPIFVDTDCLLPFHDDLDWNRYCVWIDAKYVNRVAESVVSDFEQLSEDMFEQRQHACRRLWEERLSFGGYHRAVVKQILQCWELSGCER